MTKFAKWTLFVLRVALGWLFLYAGWSHITNPKFSAAGYLAGAKTFQAFYQWFAGPEMIGITNFLAAWGLTLIGIALILGIFVRLSGILGALMMLLFYFPVLEFPMIAPHSYLVDEHIIYAAGLLVLAALRAGRAFGLETWCLTLPICSRYPRLRSWIG